jgi:hypothetical protein
MSFNGYDIMNVGASLYLDLKDGNPGDVVITQTPNPAGPALNQQVSSLTTTQTRPLMSFSVEAHPRQCGHELICDSMCCIQYLCLLDT